MPIATESDMSYEDMKSLLKNPQVKCGDCGSGLSIAWGGAFGINQYIIRCTKNIEHDKMTKYNRKQEEYMSQVRTDAGMDSTALMRMDENTMLARINVAKFPQELKPNEKRLLAIACITYGFDPIMNELTIYQGQPYVSIDGRRRKAQETGLLDGVDTRPATKQEKADWEIPEGDYFFHCDVFVKGASHPFVGWGRVRKAEVDKAKANTRAADFLPLATDPQGMAEKRAEAKALRKAFHINLPSSEDIGFEDEPPQVIITEEKPKKTKVSKEDTIDITEPLNTDTTDGNSPDIEIEQELSSNAPESNSEPPKTQRKLNIRWDDVVVPDDLDTINEVLKWFFGITKIQPKEQLETLGYSSASEVIDSPKELAKKLIEEYRKE